MNFHSNLMHKCKFLCTCKLAKTWTRPRKDLSCRACEAVLATIQLYDGESTTTHASPEILKAKISKRVNKVDALINSVLAWLIFCLGAVPYPSGFICMQLHSPVMRKLCMCLLNQERKMLSDGVPEQTKLQLSNLKLPAKMSETCFGIHCSWSPNQLFHLISTRKDCWMRKVFAVLWLSCVCSNKIVQSFSADFLLFWMNKSRTPLKQRPKLRKHKWSNSFCVKICHSWCHIFA